MYYVYQKKAESQRIPYVRTFFSVLDHLTSHDHDLTFTDIFWPFDLKNNYKNYHNYKEDRHVAYHMKAKDKSIFDLGYLYFLKHSVLNLKWGPVGVGQGPGQTKPHLPWGMAYSALHHCFTKMGYHTNQLAEGSILEWKYIIANLSYH